MAISPINNFSAILQAQNAYSNTSAQKASLAEPQVNDIKSAETFHNMVNKNFNSFAKMSPDSIIALTKQVQNGAAATNASAGSGMMSKLISGISNTIKKDEEVKKRAIVNEASLTEVIAATSEAKAVLQTAVAVRNKVHEAFSKIMDMPL